MCRRQTVSRMIACNYNPNRVRMNVGPQSAAPWSGMRGHVRLWFNLALAPTASGRALRGGVVALVPACPRRAVRVIIPFRDPMCGRGRVDR